MNKPYFLRFVNDLDFAAIEAHDRPLLERYAAAADYQHGGEYGLAVRELRGPRATIREIQEHLRIFGELFSEVGAEEVWRAFLMPGAELRFPVPFQLQLLEEELAASRYFRKAHELVLTPITLQLLTVKFFPTPKFGPLAGLLEDTQTVPGAYSGYVADLRAKQANLRRVGLALATGTRLPEPMVIEAQGVLGLRLVTDGQEYNARWTAVAPLADAAAHDLAETLVARKPLNACELSTCRRIFIPKDRRHRFHTPSCWRQFLKHGSL